ncbi:hypothetical protein G7046_g5434 [Stylonectria norvegica]|nr:hypothetical protein G7046_g5434 [Stylonectria norvegica]
MGPLARVQNLYPLPRKADGHGDSISVVCLVEMEMNEWIACLGNSDEGDGALHQHHQHTNTINTNNKNKNNNHNDKGFLNKLTERLHRLRQDLDGELAALEPLLPTFVRVSRDPTCRAVSPLFSVSLAFRLLLRVVLQLIIAAVAILPPHSTSLIDYPYAARLRLHPRLRARAVSVRGSAVWPIVAATTAVATPQAASEAGGPAPSHHFHSQTPTSIKTCTLPTYLAEWTKNGFEEAMFLGAQVAARIAFCLHTNMDAQAIEAQRLMSLSRVDYNKEGKLKHGKKAKFENGEKVGFENGKDEALVSVRYENTSDEKSSGETTSDEDRSTALLLETQEKMNQELFAENCCRPMINAMDEAQGVTNVSIGDTLYDIPPNLPSYAHIMQQESLNARIKQV